MAKKVLKSVKTAAPENSSDYVTLEDALAVAVKLKRASDDAAAQGELRALKNALIPVLTRLAPKADAAA